METPRQGRADGPLCRIEGLEPWVPALAGLAQYERAEVLYWLHLSRRDLVLQNPANDGTSRDTFSLGSPARPNPIGTAIAHLVIEARVQRCVGLIAWTAHRCSISNPIADCSRPSRRLNPEISKSAIPDASRSFSDNPRQQSVALVVRLIVGG
jgi:hypothetical protein